MFNPPFREIFSFGMVHSTTVRPVVLTPELPFPGNDRLISRTLSKFSPLPSTLYRVTHPSELLKMSGRVREKKALSNFSTQTPAVGETIEVSG